MNQDSQDILHRLEMIKQLKPGWRGPYSSPINPDAIVLATQLVNELYNEPYSVVYSEVEETSYDVEIQPNESGCLEINLYSAKDGVVYCAIYTDYVGIMHRVGGESYDYVFRLTGSDADAPALFTFLSGICSL